MTEQATERVGLWLGLQAGGFLGLYFGFSLALVSALTRPDEILTTRILHGLTPIHWKYSSRTFFGKKS